jgi:hypothetical protein
MLACNMGTQTSQSRIPLGLRILAALVIGAAVLASAPPEAARAVEAGTVVELFTSQGCSSCPPADALLGRLAERGDVIALTMAVDYWDYLGWKDTFASPSYTMRQHAYARQRGDSQVYTPQMVFNGRTHAVGSHAAVVETAIAEQAAGDAAERVAVTLSADQHDIMVKVGPFQGAGAAPEATVWLLLTTRSAEVEVARGENGGRKLTYYNVVRMMMPIGQWNGAALEIALPQADLLEGYDGCTAILQINGTGPILGAAQIDDVRAALH